MRTFLGKSDFYWLLMVLAEQWQCSLYANVLSVQSSVPTMFLHFCLQTDGLQTDEAAFSGPLTLLAWLSLQSLAVKIHIFCANFGR